MAWQGTWQSLVFAFLLGLWYYLYVTVYQRKMIKKTEQETHYEKQKAVSKTLDRFFSETEKSAKLEKMAEIERLKSEMEAKIQAQVKARQAKAKKQILSSQKEMEYIEEGNRVLLSFSEGLKSAMPETEEEKQQDMEDLMAAIKALEEMDQEHYKVVEDHSIDMGKGLLYDKISQKLNKNIRKNHYKKLLPFIQAEKLEAETMEQVKNMEHYDFLETLKLMKQTGMVKDLLEINPEMHLLIFRKEPLKLTQAEKVVFSFAGEQDILTVERLKEQTKWRPAYVNKILNGLKRKGLLEIKDDNLVIPGLITKEEREARNEKIAEARRIKMEKEAKAAEEAHRKRIELLNLKKKQEEEKKLQEQQLQKKLLEEARLEAEKTAQERRKRVEQLAEEEEKQRLERIKKMPKPKIKSLPLPRAQQPISPKPLSGNIIRDIKIDEKTQPQQKAPQPSEKTKEKEIQNDLSFENIEFDTANIDNINNNNSEEDNIPALDLGLPTADGFDDSSLDAFARLAQKMEKKMLSAKKPKNDISLEDITKLSKEVKKTKTKTNSQDTQKQIYSEKDDLSDFFSDAGDEVINDEDSEYQEQIDILVNTFNDIAPQIGGWISFDLIRNVLKPQFPDLSKIEISEIIDLLKEQSIILDEISFSGKHLYIFDGDVVIDEDMRQLIRKFTLEPYMDIDDIETATDWDEKKISAVIKRFEKQRLIKKNEKKQYYIPALVEQ